MNLNKAIRFLIATVLSAILLHVFNFDETRIAVTRAEKELTSRGFYSLPALSQCSEYQPTKGTKEEILFRRRLLPHPATGASQRCQLSVLSASIPIAIWRGEWSFFIHITSEKGAPIAEERFSVGYPKPIALLPLILFLIAIFFELPIVSPFMLSALYLFVLSATSIHSFLFLFAEAAIRTATSDRTTPGLLLILLWVVIHYRRLTADHPPGGSTVARVPRVISAFLGIWNPTFFSMMGRFSLNSRSRMEKVMSFCGIQSVLAALSLYLFLGNILGLNDNFLKSLYLPRYFTFLLTFGFCFFHWRRGNESTGSSLPAFDPWRGIVMIVATEIVFRYLHWEEHVPTLIRVGAALVLTEVPTLLRIDLRTALNGYLRLSSHVLLSIFILQASEISGVLDTAFILVDPSVHPNNSGLVTFLASTLMGFLGGSFAYAYFTVGDLITISPQTPLLRAAILDGCLVGALFSPFSVWNLIPFAISRHPYDRFLTSRYRSLSFAFFGALAVYSIDIIRTVEILRPLVFVFVMMVGIARELQKNGWEFPMSHSDGGRGAQPVEV